MEKHISFNAEKRNKAKNDSEKDFYKLLNNSFYGKTMETFRNRIRVEIIRKDDTDKFNKEKSKLISMEFKSHTKFMIVIHSDKTKVLWINRYT